MKQIIQSYAHSVCFSLYVFQLEAIFLSTGDPNSIPASRYDVSMISCLQLTQQYWFSLPFLEIVCLIGSISFSKADLDWWFIDTQPEQYQWFAADEHWLFTKVLTVLKCMILYCVLMAFHSIFCMPNQVIKFLLIFWSSVLVILLY